MYIHKLFFPTFKCPEKADHKWQVEYVWVFGILSKVRLDKMFISVLLDFSSPK